jgi:hypothetical protein
MPTGQIAQDINIGLDAICFVDDQPEREEVAFTHDKVLCVDSALLEDFLDRPALNPRFLTEDSRLRRRMYMADVERNRVEAEYTGPKEEFLATLEMVFTIAPCREEDLKRAEELTVRTNQLNSTGFTYSYEELDALRQSPRHQLLISSLEDRHGTYGKIGLTLIEMGTEMAPDVWTVKLLLMSCRVMSKGVGMIMLHHILRQAKEAGVEGSGGSPRMLRPIGRVLGEDRPKISSTRFHELQHRSAQRVGDLASLGHRQALPSEEQERFGEPRRAQGIGFGVLLGELSVVEADLPPGSYGSPTSVGSGRRKRSSADERQGWRKAPARKSSMAIFGSELFRRLPEARDEQPVGLPELAADPGACGMEEGSGGSPRMLRPIVRALGEDRRDPQRLTSRS